MMEELVNKLAYLQHNLKEEEDATNSDGVIITIREDINNMEKELKLAKDALANELKYSNETCDLIKSEIKDISAQIIDEWTGEKKTLVFDAGTLKFRTTESMEVENKTLVLTGLLDHTSTKDVATNYISGFNKTAVKKYMGVIDLPMGAVRIEKKTTVKLDQKSG